MCPETTQEELNAAGDAAHQAFLSWRNTSVLARQQIMFKLQQKLKDNMVIILMNLLVIEDLP